MDKGLIIFDMDGTTLDTLQDLTESLNFALGSRKLRERTVEEVRRFVGNGIRKLVERGVPEGTSSLLTDEVYDVFMEHYKLHCAEQTRPYDGIVSLLKALKQKGYLTATVSNKADAAVRVLCCQYFDGLFDASFGERPGVRKKPAPDLVNLALQELKVDRGQAVYVGDSEVDIETAREAGMDCISVDWGFRERRELVQAGAVVILSTPEALLSAIETRFGKAKLLDK